MVAYLLVGPTASGLFAVGSLLLLLLGLLAIIESADLDAGCKHLLELSLVPGLFFLLSFGEELALLLELLYSLLLLLLLPRLLLLLALGVFLGLLLKRLDSSFLFGFCSLVLLLFTAQFLLLLDDGGKMSGDFFLFAACLGSRGRSCWGLDLLRFDFGGFGFGWRRGSCLLLCGLVRSVSIRQGDKGCESRFPYCVPAPSCAASLSPS
jgi:hypothetical protein